MIGSYITALVNTFDAGYLIYMGADVLIKSDFWASTNKASGRGVTRLEIGQWPEVLRRGMISSTDVRQGDASGELLIENNGRGCFTGWRR